MAFRTIPEILLILMLYERSVVIRLCKQELSSVALYLIDFFIVCRFQELKAIEQLVSLLSEQPEEVMLQGLLALIPELAPNMTFMVEKKMKPWSRLDHSCRSLSPVSVA